MSIFHRRSRSASASRPQAPASASAHMAATQAFLANRASQSRDNLSASAAATALRTMSPAPTPVDQVQTKRMIQRQASLSQLSSGSGRGRSRGGLQRQHSYGSMTERTFRTPSPSPSRQPSRPEAIQAPPLPSIPQQYATAPTASGKKKKRASSQGAPPPRVLSPPPTQQTNRGQSLDRFGNAQPAVASPASQSNNVLPQVPELERTDSRNSINFSRPLSPRPQSPLPQLPLANGDRVTMKPSSQPISPAQAEEIQYDLTQTANQPVKKKKKKVAPAASEGSHLHGGTMASKPVVHPLEPASEPASQPQAPVGDEGQPRVRRRKKKAALSGQDTHFPPSDTSSRTDSDSDSNAERARERRAQRASGTLAKQPSIVREDWEGEQEEESGGVQPAQVQPTIEQDFAAGQDFIPAQSRRAYNTANVSRKIEEPAAPAKGTTQTVPAGSQALNPPKQSTPEVSNNLQLTEPRPPRENSLSPSRSTRFSDRLSSDLAAGRKHEPLPRSVSPAKSALKHHSPSPGDSSQRVRGSSVTPSESSDLSSASVDGGPKRKKSVRVSFDAQPEIVGTSDGVQSTESPNKEKKSWLGLGKAKPTLNTIPSNDDMEELMKPRPQLPSFGSVRGQKFRDASEGSISQNLSKSPPSSISASTSSQSQSTASSVNTYPSTGVSSDFAVGAILAQDMQHKASHGSNEPLPPEVTSVHGTVSFSDSESDTSEREEAPQAPSRMKAESTAPTAVSSKPATINQQVTQPELVGQVDSPVELPVVSVSPPTPKPEDQWEVELPGGFPVSHEALAQLGESQKESKEPGAEPGDTTESESDNESIYSDAAEDPAELDGTGFGSIDAIVDSPMATSAPTGIASPPESPLAHVPVSRPQPVSVGSWEQTQARWRDLAEQSRRAPAPVSSQPISADQAELPVKTSTDIASPSQAAPVQQSLPAQQKPSKPRPKKTPAAIAARASVPGTAVAVKQPVDSPRRKKNQPSAYPNVASAQPGAPPGPASHFRHSMRAASPVDTELTMRRSMRNRNSMPAPAPVSQQQRPSTAPSHASTQPRAALQKKHIPPASLSTSAAATVSAPRAAPVQPTSTNDSDSESSFRKARRSKSTAGGKYTMRRSMRGASDATLRDDGRNGVRSVSPVGRRPFSSGGGQHTMRASMRGSVDSSVPTLRGSTEAKRSSSLFGRRQESVPPVPQATMAKHRSRFSVDSDDEDDRPKPGKWLSRFAADSDDEDDLTPVRGIPRRAGDNDSTDLEDSSDEERPKTPIQPARLQIPQNVMSPARSEAISPNTEKKRGLFGRLRGKKQKEEAPSPIVESPQMPTSSDLSKPANLGFSSKAERDRMIEQTRARLEAAQSPSQPAHQTHHKLQRRQGPQRIMSDSWPLPPKIPENEENMDIRPNTADGPPMRNGSTRLNRGSMRTQEVPLEPIGRGGKKKRFPMLRKAFGLKD
ncbi:uncharacterized protein PV06_09296 [Exophiala oligosperma]|uniref:Uncharacterized protein n=1 Tax=Exophiala oligosperma TaxID=215243 RepID=A0A0D2ADQ6_9EURO|nr:uncharacterized protein PV06_09296 [Exophiala oligosperma]KIW38321.1 hypothetical protein PV06_09296 [Exophiala oligosperma]